MAIHFQLTECVQSIQTARSANDDKLIGSEHDLKFANLIADALSDALFLASEVRRLTKEHETSNSLTADDLRRKADEMDNPRLAETDTPGAPSAAKPVRLILGPREIEALRILAEPEMYGVYHGEIYSFDPNNHAIRTGFHRQFKTLLEKKLIRDAQYDPDGSYALIITDAGREMLK